jgi:hypothetical protein
MDLTTARAFVGLNTRVTPTASNVSGTSTVGIANTTVTLSGVDTAYTFDALIIGSASLVFDLADCNNTGTTSWTAGVAQVETATAVGTIGTPGNATVVVTAAGMTGSPKTISVAVANGDTAATWAGKVRTALAADTAVSALFTVSGSTTAIVLTRKPTSTWTVGTTTANVFPANDTSLNISLDNSTCSGITTAATSANTTSGVATAGVYAPDADGKDFEGNTLTAIASASVGGLMITNSEDSADSIDLATASSKYGFDALPAGGGAMFYGASVNLPLDTNLTITTSTSANALVKVAVLGMTS